MSNYDPLDSEPGVPDKLGVFGGLEERLGLFGGVVSLVLSMVGTGIVAFPFAFGLCGGWTAVLGLAGIAFLAFLSYTMLMQCTARMGVTSYGGLMPAIPKGWTYYADASLWLLLVLATTAYILIVADMIRTLILGSSTDLPLLLSDGVLFASICLVVFPLCLARSFHGLACVNTYCSCAILTVVAAIMWKCYQLSQDESNFAPARPTGLSLMLAAPILGNAMFGHMNIAQVYAELTLESKKHAHVVPLIACIAVFVLYSAVGLSGYLAFGRSVGPDVIADIARRHGSQDYIVVLMQVLLVTYILCKLPLLVMPLRSITLSYVTPGKNPNAVSLPVNAGVVFGLLTSSYLAALALPHLDLCLEVLGATCVVPMCFTVPARLAWSCVEPRPTASCIILGVSGLCISALSMIAIVYKDEQA